MAAVQILSSEKPLLITSDMAVLPDPAAVLELGMFKEKGLLCSQALLLDHTQTLEDEHGYSYTCGPAHLCKPVLWCVAKTEARSGIVIGYVDLSVMGGEGSRLLVAQPPYKKRLNFKSDMEATTFLNLNDVKYLGGPIPANGLKDLPAFLKSVPPPTLLLHYSLAHSGGAVESFQASATLID